MGNLTLIATLTLSAKAPSFGMDTTAMASSFYTSFVSPVSWCLGSARGSLARFQAFIVLHNQCQVPHGEPGTKPYC